jgi:hemolysin III
VQTTELEYYASSGARRADLIVHVIGLVFALLGGIILLRLSLTSGARQFLAVAVYVSGLISMMCFSLAYNLNSSRYRNIFRRLDHIGIFVMIAGTYTPLTTVVLTGKWAWGMTIAVWGLAGLGICGKSLSLALPDHVWTALYLGLGWIVLIAERPIAQRIPPAALSLLAAGGLVYTVGAFFYVTERSRYWRSIWHGHVVVAAGIHWVAIFLALFWPHLGQLPVLDAAAVARIQIVTESMNIRPAVLGPR